MWKRWRDEVALQARLGVMEARDVLEPTLLKLEDAIASVVSDVDDPTDVVDVEELETRLTGELGGLRRELEVAGKDFRIA